MSLFNKVKISLLKNRYTYIHTFLLLLLLLLKIHETIVNAQQVGIEQKFNIELRFY